MITKATIKAIKAKSNFNADGYSGAWYKGPDGYSYAVFVGHFPNCQSVASYHSTSGKHYISQYCPEDLRDVLLEAWATLPAFSRTFHAMTGL